MAILCSAVACPTHDLAHYHHCDVWCGWKASIMAARDCQPFLDARVGWLVDLLAVERIVLKSADEVFESKQSFPVHSMPGRRQASTVLPVISAAGMRQASDVVHRLFSCGRESA